MSEQKKVFVALSGGVDSSTTTALLLEAGYDCSGMFIITSNQNRHAQEDAECVAEKLEIELHVLDLRDDFQRILNYLYGEYKNGRTPNPCVVCNQLIKFGKLWDFARTEGAEFLATGHYARILKQNGQVGLYEAACTSKDQSYVLSMIDKNVLQHVILPMGDYSKDETRTMATKFGLRTEHKQESQDICFMSGQNYVSILEKQHPELICKGNIVDSIGNIIGEHNGVHRFTIGQRRGLRIAMGEPYYVTRLDAASNTVTLGPKEQVLHTKLWATDINWMTNKSELPFRARVKIRYNDNGAPATVFPQNDTVAVEFDEPRIAITPGQLAVFYTEDKGNSRVSGAGWIDKVGD